MPVILALLAACTGAADDSAAPDACADQGLPTAYDVTFTPDPDPLVANETGTLTWTVDDQDGCPIQDLQISHERMGHLLVISGDLASFQHVHMEDYAEITADVLRTATYQLPLTVPTSGPYLLVLDYAHANQFLQAKAQIDVTGEPAQRDAPEADFSTTVDVDDVTVSIDWIVEPVAGYEADWQVHITSGGEDVTDIVQYLGADAHAALVAADLSWAGHTHAWIEGMDQMTPSMSMAHVYDGPDILFKAVLPEPGLHKMWVQFTRGADPSHVYTVPFMFEVGG